MKKVNSFSVILILVLGLLPVFSYSQVSYLGKTFQFQDGVFGLGGTRSICFSPDKRNIYVSSQYALAVFSYNAATSETVFLEAYKDGDNGIRGLYSGGGVVVSPDGKYVYVSSESDNCVAHFSRYGETGLLKFEAVYYDNEAGNEGLRGAYGMQITNNGSFMYFTSWNDAKISAYQRDTITGGITHLQSIGRYEQGGLSRPRPLKISNDNRYLYAASMFDNAISVFEIDQTSGLLSFVQKIDDEIYHPEALEISNDDSFVYLACVLSFMIFERDIQSGILVLKEKFNYDDPNINGLHGLYSVTVSPDDKNIYAISGADTSFVTFLRELSTNQFQFVHAQPFMNLGITSSAGYTATAMLSDSHTVFGTSYWEMGFHKLDRNPTTGILSYGSFTYDGQDATISGLYNPRHCCTDYNQENIYVTTGYSGISIFNRNDTTGLLTYKNVVDDSDAKTNLLQNAHKSMISLDNKYLYTISGFNEGSGILIFEIDHDNYDLIPIDSVIPYEHWGPLDIVMSPNMKHVYVVFTFGYDAIMQLDYNPQSGALTNGVYYDFIDVKGDFDNISISNNGDYVFTISDNNNCLNMFKRNHQSGELIHCAEYTSYLPGDIYAGGLVGIDISKDNKNVYAVYEDSDLLVNYSIDQINDTLHILQIFDYETLGIDGLQGIDRVRVRNDGTFLYATSRKNSSLGLYHRNSHNGMLSFVNDFTEPEYEFDGLDGVAWIDIVQNDRSLYLISNIEEGIASFKIDLYLGPDISICSGDTALLDAGMGYETYLWSTNETTRQIKVTEAGNYFVETIDEFGFTDIDSIFITTLESPIIDLGDNIDACIGEYVELNVEANEIVLWNTGSTNTNILVNKSGEYWVRVTNENQCLTSDTINVYFHDIPHFNLGADTTIGLNQSLTLYVNHASGNNYLWYNGTTDTLIVINSNTINNDTLQAWLKVTDYYGCKNTDQLMIYVDPNANLPESEIEIGPIPTADFVCVQSTYPIVKIECFNTNGKHVFTQNPNLRKYTVHVEHLGRGIYYLIVTLNNGYSEKRKIMRL